MQNLRDMKPAGNFRIQERKKQDLQNELDRLGVSHKQSLEQYNRQIYDLTQRRDTLERQVEELRGFYSTLTQSYDQAKQDLKEYKDKQMKEANVQLEQTRALALSIEKRATAKEHEIEERERQVAVRDRQQEIFQNKMQEEYERFRNATRAFDEIRFSWESNKQKRDTEYIQLADNIATLTEEVQKLEGQIIEQKRILAEGEIRASLREQDITERAGALSIAEAAVTNRQAMLDKQHKEQEDEGVRLKDRNETLERAIIEMRGKGVTI